MLNVNHISIDRCSQSAFIVNFKKKMYTEIERYCLHLCHLWCSKLIVLVLKQTGGIFPSLHGVNDDAFRWLVTTTITVDIVEKRNE